MHLRRTRQSAAGLKLSKQLLSDMCQALDSSSEDHHAVQHPQQTPLMNFCRALHLQKPCKMHATQQLPSTRVRACGPNRAFVRAAVRPRVSTRAYLEEKQTGAGQTAQGTNQLEGTHRFHRLVPSCCQAQQLCCCWCACIMPQCAAKFSML